MKEKQDETTQGLNQIFEIINTKGDIGELEQIVQKSEENTNGESKSPTE